MYEKYFQVGVGTPERENAGTLFFHNRTS